jgi:hypothetical protein
MLEAAVSDNVGRIVTLLDDGADFEVHLRRGPGFLESVYERA